MTTLEHIILTNPGISVSQISKLSGVGISQVMKVKHRLKKSDPEKFGLEKRYKVNEQSLCEVADQVLGGMTGKDKKGYLGAIVKKLLAEGRISNEDAEEMGITN